MLYDVLFTGSDGCSLDKMTVDTPSSREARAAAVAQLGTDSFKWYRTLKHKEARSGVRRACTVIYSNLEPDDTGAPCIKRHCIEVLGTYGSNEKTVRTLARKQGNPIPSAAMITDIAPHKPDTSDVVAE